MTPASPLCTLCSTPSQRLCIYDTRNSHGAGFWDGDWPEPAAMILTDAAHNVGEIEIYTNDRGHPRVYGR